MHPRVSGRPAIRTAATTVATIAASVALVGMGASAGHATVGGSGQGDPGPQECQASQLSIDATMHRPAENIMGVAVTNDALAGPACTIGGIPTATFGDLDGSARPIPDGAVVDQLLAPGETVHAAMQTAPGMDDDGAHLVPDVTIAGSAAHYGSTFTAEELGSTDPGVYVYDPVTTRWHASYANAEETLLDELP